MRCTLEVHFLFCLITTHTALTSEANTALIPDYLGDVTNIMTPADDLEDHPFWFPEP